MNETEKEAILFEASLAEQCERPKDVLILRKLLQYEIALTHPQAVMLIQAHKACATEIISSRRVLSAVLQKETSKGGKLRHETVALKFKENLATELADVCRNCLVDLDILLAQPDLSSEHHYKYNAFKVNFLAYLLDCLDEGREKEKIFNEHTEAQNWHFEYIKNLEPTDPVKLSFVLSTVGFLNLKGEVEKAREIAQGAFDAAIVKLEDVPEETYHEVTLQLSLLHQILQEQQDQD